MDVALLACDNIDEGEEDVLDEENDKEDKEIRDVEEGMTTADVYVCVSVVPARMSVRVIVSVEVVVEVAVADCASARAEEKRRRSREDASVKRIVVAIGDVDFEVCASALGLVVSRDGECAISCPLSKKMILLRFDCFENGRCAIATKFVSLCGWCLRAGSGP